MWSWQYRGWSSNGTSGVETRGSGVDLIFINVAEKAIVPVAVVVALLVIQTRGTVAKAVKTCCL